MIGLLISTVGEWLAQRVERVYDKIMVAPRTTILGRIKNNLSLGLFAGIASVLIVNP